MNGKALIIVLLSILVNIAHASGDHDDHEDHHDERALSDRKQWTYSLVSALVVVVSVAICPIIFWLLARENLIKINNFLICFGGGAILSLIFSDLIVEVDESIGLDWKSTTIILGAYFLSIVCTYGLDKEEECCENHISVCTDNVELGNLTNPTANPELNVNENIVTQHNKRIWGKLVTIGDAFCNFSDGLIIAGAFSGCGINTGIATTLAILFHEVTHEIGDFAILLDSGFSFKESMCANIATACVTLVGVTVGNIIIMYSDDHEIVGYFLSFGIGVMMFVVTNVLPRAVRSKTRLESTQKSFVLLMGMGLTTFLLSSHADCH